MVVLFNLIQNKVRHGGIVLTAFNMKDTLLQILLVAGTSVIGYVLGYRKQNVDLQSSRLENLEKSINVYNLIIDDMAKKIETLTTEVAGLERRIEELMAENKQLKNKATI